MRIVRVETWTAKMRLEEPYEVAYGGFCEVENVFVRLHTDTKLCGLGCAAPDEYVTGERPEGVEEVIRGPVQEALVGRDPLRLWKLLERIVRRTHRMPSARAAVDMALWDILGKKGNLPLFRLLGGYRTRMKTSATIGIENEENTLRKAAELVGSGFLAIKIKGGRDLDSDVARTLKVREAVGGRIALRFDANQGYTAKQALEYVERTRRAVVEVIEQPTPRRELGALEEVTKGAHIPVMADESVVTSRDAFRIARRGIADMLNIKLMKVGGIAASMGVAEVARLWKLGVMVGCMDESALGIAAGLHFALARPHVELADLDGHIGLCGDPFEGLVKLENGYLRPSKAPGLGWTKS